MCHSGKPESLFISGACQYSTTFWVLATFYKKLLESVISHVRSERKLQAQGLGNEAPLIMAHVIHHPTERPTRFWARRAS